MEGPVCAGHFASLSHLILTPTRDGGALYCHRQRRKQRLRQIEQRLGQGRAPRGGAGIQTLGCPTPSSLRKQMWPETAVHKVDPDFFPIFFLPHFLVS